MASDPQRAARALARAGFRGQDLVRAVAIAGRESNYDNTAQNLNRGTGDHSIGYMQINQLAHKGRFGTDQQLMNPDTNARAAYSLFKQAGWRPWTTNSKVDNLDLARARRIIAGTDTGGASVTSGAPTAPAAGTGYDSGQDRRTMLLNYLQQRDNPNALLSLAAGLQNAGSGQPVAAGDSSGQPAAPTGTMRPNTTGGARSAISWIQSKVGDPSSKETGTNSGGLASYANQRFGMSNQPWCAMFTSLAVTKGGAPAVARTASVAEVRRQAQQGGGGYDKGFVSRPRPGDLILWGNNHIAMVESVRGNQVTYIGGNQSNDVTRRTTRVGDGDYVRPKYSR